MRSSAVVGYEEVVLDEGGCVSGGGGWVAPLCQSWGKGGVELEGFGLLCSFV